MRSLIVASLVAITIASVGSPAVARDRTPPIATPVGKPISCVNLRQIRETRVHGDSVIDFHMNGRKVYRNVLPNSCPSLGFEERFSYKTSLSQLCSVDIITVLRSPGLMSGASCGLGEFQPVELAKRTRSGRAALR